MENTVKIVLTETELNALLSLMAVGLQGLSKDFIKSNGLDKLEEKINNYDLSKP